MILIKHRCTFCTSGYTSPFKSIAYAKQNKTLLKIQTLHEVVYVL